MAKTIKSNYSDAELRALIRDEVRQVFREEIPVLLNNEAGHIAAVDQDGFIDMDQAAAFIKLKKSTLYVLVHKNKIPFHKSGKRTLFKKSELEIWVNSYNGK